jgi:hypothetical protein
MGNAGSGNTVEWLISRELFKRFMDSTFHHCSVRCRGRADRQTLRTICRGYCYTVKFPRLLRRSRRILRDFDERWFMTVETYETQDGSLGSIRCGDRRSFRGFSPQRNSAALSWTQLSPQWKVPRLARRSR